MPRINKYEYPARDIDDCVSYLKKAYDQAKAYVMTREIFADAAGLSVGGGGFNVLVGSMSIYKLIETGEGEIRFTELTKKILHGETNEKTEAVVEAVRNVTLIADMYDSCKGIPTDEQIRLFLRSHAGADIGQAQEIAKHLSKLFKRVAKYLIITDGETYSEDSKETANPIIDNEPTKTWKLISPYGSMLIKDSASLEAAKALLVVAEKTFSENSSNHIKGEKGSTKPT